MYLVTTEDKVSTERGARAVALGGLAGLVVRGWRWWRARALEQQRRTAKKQLFLLETMVLGPKQRVVLMRCGAERFLVGVGAEGVTSVVRVEDGPAPEELPQLVGGDGHWG
jgi:flagellar biogenesis protein FliO